MTTRVHLDELHDFPTPQPGEIPASWQPVSLADLPDKPPVEPTLGGLGLVYPGYRHVFSGPQESAKTLAAYIVALHVIREGGTIILIDFEMGRWTARNRLQDLGATHDELHHVIYVEPSEPVTDAAILNLAATQPDLAIIDAAAGAYDASGLDDNKRSDVERFARSYIRGFWLAEIATIVVDHVVKNTENRSKYAIGSERKTGGADVHLGFDTITPIKRGSTGLYKIVTHKDRGGYLKRGKLAELQLNSSSNTHQITWQITYETDAQDAQFRPTHVMETVSRWLEDQDAPRSQTAVEKGHGGNAVTVRKAIDVLVKEKHIKEEWKGQTRLLSYVRSYREQLDAQPRPTPSNPVPTPSGRGHTSNPVPGPLGPGGDGVVDDQQNGQPRPADKDDF